MVSDNEKHITVRKLLLIAVLIPFFGFQTKKNSPRIFIAGDSTAQTYDSSKTVMRGWGQCLQTYLTDKIEVVNKAKAGRSTKSFLDEGRWAEIVGMLDKNDWVMIQFSHNDTSKKPERHASPIDFRNNLIRFINDVRAKKANPVLVTSIVMRTFQNGNLVDDRLKSYPGIMRQVAREYNVPLLDINQRTRDMILRMGDEASKSLYMWIEPGIDPSKPDGSKDDTHMRQAGADSVARFVSEEIRALQLKGLVRYLR